MRNILYQKYPVNSENWVHFELRKEMQFKYMHHGRHAQVVHSPFHTYACINDSKRGKPYAAWTMLKNDGVAVYIRWPKENIIMLWGTYWDVQSARESINWKPLWEICDLEWAKFAEINKIQ